VISSPTCVVLRSGPGLLPFSAPNLGHALRAATAGATASFLRTVRILRVARYLRPVEGSIR